MDHHAGLCTHILTIIRGRSESGRIVRAEEIMAELREQGHLASEDDEPEAHWETMLEHVLKENSDLKVICGRNGIPHYYSAQSLSATYAGILVWKSDDPLWMLAEVVRENSRLYPRPVPIDGFREPPFGLTREEIVECLKTMGELREYRDIAQTITSVGTLFLYSTQHLDADHAFTLAEWLDVGQVNSP